MEPGSVDLLRDALTVQERREATVPELEAGAGDHREVDVHRRLGDTLVEHRPVSTLERPESARGRLTRLRGRLAKSNTMLGKGLLVLLSRERIDQDTWDEIEDTLILADLGAPMTGIGIDSLIPSERLASRGW